MADPNSVEGLFGNSIDFFKGALKGTAGTAIGLGGALLTGQQKLSAYSGALANNTEAFGKLAGQVGKVVDGLAQFAEASLAEYQALSGIGATFNKEIKDIKVAAAELGLTVEEMTGLFKENMRSLSAFGGTTDSAIASFKSLSNTVLDSKELGTELRRLGYTTKDINEGLLTYGEITDANARSDRASIQAQAQSAKDFMVELDGLAKLTGKQRDQIADEMKERRRQGDINAYLMGKSAEEQEAFMLEYEKIAGTLGEDAANLFADMALRGAPTTETTQGAYLAMGEGARSAIEQAVAGFESGDLDAFSDSMTRARGAAMDYQDTEEFRNTAILGGVTGVSNAYADASAAAYDFKNRLDSVGDGDMSAAQKEAQIRTEILEQQTHQMEQVTGIFDKTIEIQENLREVSTQVMESTIDKIEDVAIAALEKVQAVLPSADEIAAGINKGVGALFDIAQLSDAQDRGTAATNQIGSDIVNNASAIGSDIVNSNAEGAKVTSDTVTTTSETTQKLVDDAKTEVTRTQEALAEAEENLAAATKDVSDLVTQGFTALDPNVRAAMEAASNAEEQATAVREDLREAETALLNAISESNRVSATQKYGNLPTTDDGTTDWRFAPRHAKGGKLDVNEVALVGESGAEFVAGPGEVMSANTSMGVMQNLMKSIKAIDNSIQETQSNAKNTVSTTEDYSSRNTNNSEKYDVMISLLRQLVQVETQAVGTQRKTMKATQGLTGNLLRGV